MDSLLRYIFILSLVLILVAYYAGLVTDSNAFFKGGNQTLNTVTGRNSAGQFAGYPSGFVPVG